jgi:hypothetical protein
MNTNEIITNDKCKGCKLKSSLFYICVMNDKMCPCQSCLLKGICDSLCGGFINFLHNKLINEDSLSVEEVTNTFKTSSSPVSRQNTLFFLQYYKLEKDKSWYFKVQKFKLIEMVSDHVSFLPFLQEDNSVIHSN